MTPEIIPPVSDAQKEKNREACRRWKSQYPERYKAAQKKWYAANRAKKTEYSKQYSKHRRATDPKWREETTRRVRERYQTNEEYRLRANKRGAERSRAKQPWKHDAAKQKAIEARYRRAYGLTVKDVERMRAAQKGRCAICKEKRDRLVIDHCHATNKIRNLLCTTCNTGLGAFRDSVDVLEAAIHYLIKHSQNLF